MQKNILSIISLLLISAVANAEGFFTGIGLGAASTASNFSSEDSSSLYGGYKTQYFAFSVGGESEYRFRHNGPDNTFVDIENKVFLRAAYIFDLSWMDIEVGGGSYFWEADAYLAGRHIASQDDSSVFADVRFVKVFDRMFGVDKEIIGFGLQLNWRQVDDVVGSDLEIVELGIEIEF